MRPYCVTTNQGNIKTPLCKSQRNIPFVTIHYLQADVRKGRAPRTQKRLCSPSNRWNTNPKNYLTFRATRMLSTGSHKRFHVRKNAARFFNCYLAASGKPDAAMVPLEQCQTEFIFQFADTATYCRNLDIEELGSTRESTRIRARNQTAQICYAGDFVTKRFEDIERVRYSRYWLL